MRGFWCLNYFDLGWDQPHSARLSNRALSLSLQFQLTCRGIRRENARKENEAQSQRASKNSRYARVGRAFSIPTHPKSRVQFSPTSCFLLPSLYLPPPGLSHPAVFLKQLFLERENRARGKNPPPSKKGTNREGRKVGPKR